MNIETANKLLVDRLKEINAPNPENFLPSIENDGREYFLSGNSFIIMYDNKRDGRWHAQVVVGHRFAIADNYVMICKMP